MKLVLGRLRSLQFVRVVLATSFATLPLRAETNSSSEATPEVAAEALFVEGRRLMGLGRYEEACAKFRESQRLDSGIGTLMNLALCYKSSGRTASAWSTYRQAASLAAAGKQVARERVARREALALEAHLSTLEVRVPAPPRDDFGVVLDGLPMSAELVAVPTPVDPGSHELRAVRGGRTLWSTNFRVAPGERSVVSIPEAALERGEVTRSDSGTWTGLHSAAVVQAGVGLAASGIGVALMLSAKSDDDEAARHCLDDTLCSEEGFEGRERAIDKKKIATVSFVVAGASFVGAGLLWFSAPSPWASPRKPNRSDEWSIGFSSSW